MTSALEIQDGSPIWNSLAIVPSRDSAVSTGSSPAFAAITVGATDVCVYVKVDNIGTDDVGHQPCPTGAWTQPVALSGFLTSGPGGGTGGGFTFTAQAGGDTLRNDATNAVLTLGNPASGRRAWGWSPSGSHFFAYAFGPAANGTDWRLKVIALNGATRNDGTPIAPGTKVLDYPAPAAPAVAYSNVWTANNFRWIADRAVFCSGTAPSGGISRAVACFRTAAGSTYAELVPAGLTWRYRASPCGSRIAFLAEVAPPATHAITFVSTETASVTQSRVNNIATALVTNGQAPGIQTLFHTAKGVEIDQGAGGTVLIDDSDGTGMIGGLRVDVDRVKASTLPSANLGVRLVGWAAGGIVSPGPGPWVQVPNSVGWDNQGEQHWCLLAQAYATASGIPKPWDGQAVAPPPFPLALSNCAQRNVNIAP